MATSQQGIGTVGGLGRSGGEMLGSGIGSTGFGSASRADGRYEGRGEGKDDVRTQFITREGCYRLAPMSDYRLNRIQPTAANNVPVRISFVRTSCSTNSGVTDKNSGSISRTGGASGGLNCSTTSGNRNCSNVANGGIYVGWRGSSLGCQNGPSSGEHGSGNGWSTGYPNSSLDMGLSATCWNGGVNNSWNSGGLLGNGGSNTSSSWMGSKSNFSSSENQADDRICFNIGKELYVYVYNGVQKAIDLSRPIDKRLYRGTSPTCHDFNSVTCRNDRAMLVVGFTAGQIQLIDPIGKEISRLYNEERHIDKTRVTCIRWLPDSPNQFLVSHLSGQLYVYDEALPCAGSSSSSSNSSSSPPAYQLFKAGEGFSVFTCRARSTRNPLYRWLIDGSPPINEFAFSPCSRYLAVACGDGFLRVYDYNRLELVGTMKSYFGGLLCVSWSPDGKLIATGGEDDLVTVWSFIERRVICRGRGHTSWVSVVAFDPYTTTPLVSKSDIDVNNIDGNTSPHLNSAADNLQTNASSVPVSSKNEDNQQQHSGESGKDCKSSRISDEGFGSSGGSRSSITHKGCRDGVGAKCSKNCVEEEEHAVASYRFGSVGQDTVLCLWDVTEDVLYRPTRCHQRSSIAVSSFSSSPSATTVDVASTSTVVTTTTNSVNHIRNSSPQPPVNDGDGLSSATSSASSLSHKFPTLSLHNTAENGNNGTSKHRHSNSSSSTTKSDSKSSSKASNTAKAAAAVAARLSEAAALLGTNSCPGLHDVPLLEPLTRKKVANERLSSLVFREDCFVTACLEGNVYTWARPAAWVNPSTGAMEGNTPPHRDSVGVPSYRDSNHSPP